MNSSPFGISEIKSHGSPGAAPNSFAKTLLFAAALMLALASAAIAQSPLVSLVGDKDNFGYGGTADPSCAFYNLASGSLPAGDGNVFDQEAPGADPGTWTHNFTLPPGASVISATLSIPEKFSNSTSSTINIDGEVSVFTPGSFTQCSPAVARTFNIDPSALLDGQLNITVTENGDDIALDYAELTIEYTEGSFVYVNNNANFNEPSNSVSAFKVNSDGTLATVPGSPFATGATSGLICNNMDSIAVDKNGRRVYATNTSGSVSGFDIASDGSLTPVPGSPFSTAALPIGVAVDPLGRFLYVANHNGASVSVYSIAPNGSLLSIGGSPFSTINGTWTLEVHPSGNFLYAVARNEGDRIDAFAVSASGALTPVPGSPYSGPENSHGSEITSDGKFLYVQTFGYPYGILAYSISSTDGTLTSVGGSPFGSGAHQGIAANPSGTLLFGSTGNSIQVRAIAGNGALSDIVGSPFTNSPGALYPHGFVVSADGKYLYATNDGSPHVSAFDIAPSGALTSKTGSPYNKGAAGCSDGIALFSGGVAVESNAAPVAADDSLSTDEDTPLSDNVLTNDTDADGDALTATLVSGPTNDPGFVLNTDGSFTYTPAADFNGSDSFTYKVNDGTVDSNVATVTITVNAVNDVPVLAGVPALATTDEMVAYGFTATATDPSDAPANNLSFSLVGEPTGAAIDPATGAFTWTPTEAQGPGDHTFTVKVTDDGTPALSDEQSITITVNEVNVAPVLGTVGNQTGNWGNNIGFTATASDSDLPANSLSFSLIGAPAGAGINSATGLFAWTPLPGQIGMHTFTVRVTDNGTPSLFDEETITVTVTKRPTTLDYGGDLSEQYSDQASLSATLTDSQTGLPIAGRTVGFVIGTQNTSGVTNSSGVATSSLILTQNPDLAYNVVSSFVEDAFYLASGDSDAFDILDEDAQAYYTGALYAGTSSTTSSTATVTLAATIKDITALCDPIAVPGCDELEGDIRNAKVTFVNRDVVDASNWTGFQIITADVPVGLVDLSDTTVGTASRNVSINIGTNDSLSITVGVYVNGWYVGDSSGESTVITISKPIPGLVTGGGYLVLTDSAGLYPGEDGTKANFGFNIRKDNKMRSPKGNINIIVRNGGRIYQIKGNAMTSLAVNTTQKTATFNGKANITDITDPLAPFSVDGNGSLQVVMIDRGEPGKTDTIGITLWNKDGGLWFTSNWDGTRTIEQVLAGGNLVVR